MNSAGFTVLDPFDTDLSEAFDTRERIEGDLGMALTFDDVFRSPKSPFCFFVGESLLVNVKARLLGRSRLVDVPGLSGCDASNSSEEPFRDLEDRAVAGLLGSLVECDDVAREP